ncbi:hypothetical protein EB001_25575 [bacterium]|nr:hypothetical protein [bacterium]
MPNWIRNNVEFSGNEEVIARMKEEIKSEDRVIDFNKIAPIPIELVDTQSPTRIISQEEYDQQEERIAKGELTDSEKQWGLSRGLTQELADEYRAKFGHSDWYGWQNANWGTKWNASDSEDYGDFIEFNTAWATPFYLLVALSKKYPEVRFSVRYADEDFGHNVGEFVLQNGEEVECNIPEGGTYEAYVMAMDIQYGGVDEYFDCNEEIFNELWDDEEELGNYISMMIDIAYDHDCYPYEDCEYHKLVLERFKEKAIADEKFELVALIQKELDKVIEE